MQNRLTKILALGAIALSLGACGGSSAKVLQLNEVFAFADGTFTHAGEKIQVKQIAVLGQYGNTLIVGQPYVEGGSIFDLQSFEVELKSQPKWKGPTNGRYANVNVTGTLENVNERPVLKNGSIKINAEAQYDEAGNRIDNDGAYSAGYWSTSQITRTYWDQYMGRNQTGAVMEGIFQLASVPAAITTEQGTEFKVVFPGENTDGTDEDNEYLITVTMPNGLNETAVGRYNAYFQGSEEDEIPAKQVGDFVQFMGLTRYDKTKGGMGIVMENYWSGWCSEVADEDKPEVLSTWAEVQTKYSSKYLYGIPNLGCEAEGVFSYGVTNYFNESLEDLFEDSLDDLVVDTESSGLLEFNFNCGSAKVEAVFAALQSKLITIGFALDEDYSDYSEGEDESYSLQGAYQVFIGLADKSVIVDFIGPKAQLTLGTFNTALAAYAEYAEFETKIPALSLANDAKVSSAVLDLSARYDLAEAENFMITATMGNDAFADDDAWEAFYESIEDALVAAGFTADVAFTAAGAKTGFLDEQTGEYVALYSHEDADEKYDGFILDIYLIAEAGQDYLYDVSASAQWTPALFGYYALDLANLVGIAGSQAGLYLIDSETPAAEGLDVYIGAYNAGYESTLLSYTVSYCIPVCAQQASNVVTTDSAAYEGAKDYSVKFVLNGPEAGKLLQANVVIGAAGTADSPYFTVDIFATVIDAPAA